jgi:chromosome segregation ATPase
VQKNYSFVEKSYLEVYKSLVDLPDFALVVQEYDALDASLKQFKNKEQTLLGQISQLQEEIAHLKDTTNHDQVDDLQLRLAEKEAEWQAVLDERSSQWKEAEYALNRQIEQLTLQIQSLSAQQQLAQEHLVDTSSEIHSKLSAKVSEAELLASELARIKGELAKSQRENQELTGQLEGGHFMTEIAQ